jgi:hypothetical protein
MQPLAKMLESLQKFTEVYHLPVSEIQQGSAGWLRLKLGVISASNAARAVAKKDSETRHTYMCELVAQVCTGVIEEINGKPLDWGREHEVAARSSYEFATESSLTQIPFVFRDETFRVGCSPDGIIPGIRGAEIKCPWNSTHFVKFIADDELKSEWSWQINFCMWVTEAMQWDVVQYDPRMKCRPLHYITVDRDEKKIATLNDAIPQFISDMDKLLERAGCKFGDQWKR